MNKRINTDGNLAALSQYEQRMDEIDALNEQFEEDANEYAFDFIVTSDEFFDHLVTLPDEVYAFLAEQLFNQHSNEKVDYCEVGKMLVQHMTDQIKESKQFDDVSERWIESQQGN